MTPEKDASKPLTLEVQTAALERLVTALAGATADFNTEYPDAFVFRGDCWIIMEKATGQLHYKDFDPEHPVPFKVPK
jgi:hypothetical protein